MEVERTFRGITAEMALDYLEGLGGDRAGDARVEGDGWSAVVETREPVAIGPTLELTPVAVTFEGDAATLEDVVDAFTQKAMRAGG